MNGSLLAKSIQSKEGTVSVLPGKFPELPTSIARDLFGNGLPWKAHAEFERRWIWLGGYR